MRDFVVSANLNLLGHAASREHADFGNRLTQALSRWPRIAVFEPFGAADALSKPLISLLAAFPSYARLTSKTLGRDNAPPGLRAAPNIRRALAAAVGVAGTIAAGGEGQSFDLLRPFIARAQVHLDRIDVDLSANRIADALLAGDRPPMLRLTTSRNTIWRHFFVRPPRTAATASSGSRSRPNSSGSAWRRSSSSTAPTMEPRLMLHSSVS